MSHDGQGRLLHMLRQRGLMSSSTHKVLSGFMAKWDVDIFRAVIETHLVDENQMADLLATELKLPRLSRVRLLTVPENVLMTIPFDLALDLAVFPFEISENGRLHVAVADPSDSATISKIEAVTNRSLEIFVGERSEIIAAVQRQYPLSLQVPSLLNMGKHDGKKT